MVRNTIGLRDRMDGGRDWLDIQTIRRRVAQIKRGWSEAERCARSVEGVRRREVLARLLLDSECADLSHQDSCATASSLRIHESSLI